MRFLLTSDWHLRNTTPENRTDNFFLAQLNKIEQIFQISKENKVDFILQAGDFFDTSRPSFETIQYIIELFNKYNINNNNFFSVAGQHDLHYRILDRTALKLMESLKYITICKKMKLSEDIYLYGVSWEDEIPTIEDSDKFNILLIHKTIIDKQKYSWQENYLLSDKMFKKYPFDVVLAGDNHSPVFYQNKDQTIIGCGTISRKSIAEAEIIPHVYILDIDEKDDLTYTLKKIELLYEPADKVFRAEALTREITKENVKLQEFIESIKNNEISSSLDFKKNLETIMKNSDKAVKDIILKELEEIEEK